MYTIGHKLSKRDKLGIHRDIEGASLKLLALLIEAAFMRKESKLKILEIVRIHTEVLKHLIRSEHELGISDEKTYIRISKDLIEISKMISGWIAYCAKGA